MSSVFSRQWGLRSPRYTPALLPVVAVILGCVGLTDMRSFPFSQNSALAKPVSQSAAESISPGKPDLVTQKLWGQWLTKDPEAGEMRIFLFSPEGKLFIISGQSSSGNATACQFQYRINPSSQPMQIDIIAGEKNTVQTVFEFTTGGDLRLQMQGIQPSQPRPAALAGNATELQKISDDTTLPANTEIKKCV